MKVKIRSSLSSPRRVFSGLPQGSVPSPLLSIVYISFSVSSVSCKFKIFTDDIKLYLAFDSLPLTSDDFAILHTNTDQLVKSSGAWGLMMNVDKCVAMRLARKSSTLPNSRILPYKFKDDYINFVSFYSDLGVCIDRSLNFHEHVWCSVASLGKVSTNLLSCTV